MAMITTPKTNLWYSREFLIETKILYTKASPMNKSPEAFRTIREVSQELGVPQHVLRFWETKFNQVRPLKRGGGRRYYRPEDLDLLRKIQSLLYSEGYTIRGVQKLMREAAGSDYSGLSKADSKEKVGKIENLDIHNQVSSIVTELETLRDMLRGRIPI